MIKKAAIMTGAVAAHMLFVPCAATLAAIRQEWDRWERGGRRGTFYAAFARRWCSSRTDAVGHRNLVRNLTLIMRQADTRRATR